MEEIMIKIAFVTAASLIIGVLAIFLAKILRWLFGYGGTEEKTERLKEVDKEKEKASLLASLSSFDDSEFVSTLKRIVLEEPPASCVMILAADKVLDSYLLLLIKLAHEDPSSGLPTNLEEFVIWAEENRSSQDLIGRRRFGWFIISGFIKIASAKAHAKPELQDDILEIWLHLIKSGAYTYTVLKRNLIWTDEEKALFSHIKDEKKGLHFALNHIAPKWIRQHSKIKSFAEINDLRVALL